MANLPHKNAQRVGQKTMDQFRILSKKDFRFEIILHTDKKIDVATLKQETMEKMKLIAQKK